jgi:PAS domain S-box-containing protein
MIETSLDIYEEFIEALAENSPAMLWLGDENGKCVFLNAALRMFWGVEKESVADFDWGSTLHPDDVAQLSGPFGEAMAKHSSFTVQARYKHADGTYRTMRTTANPRFDKNGRFQGMTGVNVDITDQVVAEEHTRLLLAELNHRTKNILAVVMAIARTTGRQGASPEFIASFSHRLQGLSASNDLLVRTDWAGVEIDELLRAQLAYLDGSLGDRLSLDGPALRLSSHCAQVLGMAIHELSTNCLKYGAFSNDRGRVQVTWRLLEDEHWEIEWREFESGPATKPDRKGFGHTVTIDMVASVLGATVTMDYLSDGLRWHALCSRR